MVCATVIYIAFNSFEPTMLALHAMTIPIAQNETSGGEKTYSTDLNSPRGLVVVYKVP